MGTLIHIAEVAGLLFVAYVAGWLIGYVAHRLAARAPEAAVVPAPQLAAAKGEVPSAEDALVKTPVVVPVTSAPPPTHMPAQATPLEPVKATAVPDGLAPAGATPIEVAQPAKAATPISGLDSLKTLSTDAPLMTPELAVAAAPVPEPVMVEAAPVERVEEPAPAAVPEVVATPEPAPVVVAEEPAPVAAIVPDLEPPPAPEPEAAPEPIVVQPPPMPATRPGVAWAGAIGGREAAPFEPAAAPSAPAEAVEPEPSEPAPTPEVPAFNIEVLGLIADKLKQVDDLDQPVPAAADVPAPLVDVPTEATAPVTVEAAVPDVQPATEGEPALEPVAAVTEPAAATPPKPFDEDAAMRAIEGGWSRRASRSLPDAPEMTDVSAAVSAAQMAVEQVLARNGVDAAEPESRAQAAFGKPRGLPHPRPGGRDNLKQINGLGPLDESTLNNMGIYHFDQIATWDQKEVLWLENHAFARGRIGREDWQAQARELMGEGEARSAGR